MQAKDPPIKKGILRFAQDDRKRKRAAVVIKALYLFQHYGGAAGQIQADARFAVFLQLGGVGLVPDASVSAKAVVVRGKDDLVLACLRHRQKQTVLSKMRKHSRRRELTKQPVRWQDLIRCMRSTLRIL